jgi:predicted glycosyltransferase
VDHEPAGVWDELVAPIQALRSNGRSRVILGLRDILDEPERVARSWSGGGIDTMVAQNYDDILIYGNAAFYPSDTAYGLEALRPGHVRYCGAVTTVQPAPRIRWAGAPRRVLVSGGGGRDAYALLDTALAGLEALPTDRRPEVTLVAGPLMDTELSAALAQRARQVGAIFKESVNDLPARLAASDLFVTMGGYNSVTEALATGCPAVVVPRVGPSGEQRIRAERLQAMGLATVIWRHDLTAARMAAALTTRPPAPIASGLSFDGAAVAAAHIASVLAAQTRSDPDEISTEVPLHA